MRQAIDFYFDFTSPYGYLAAHLIEPLAARHGRAMVSAIPGSSSPL